MVSLKELIEESAEICNKCITINTMGSYFVKPFTHKQMENLLKEGIINEKIIDGLNGMTKYMPNLGSEIYIDFSVNEFEDRNE